MTRVTIALIFCISAPAMLSWLAEPASVGFMSWIFIITAPVTIAVGLPIIFRLHFNVDYVCPFWSFALRSITAGVVVWTPPFIILAIVHGDFYEVIGGIILAVLGAAPACLFWFAGVWMNPALPLRSNRTA